eukprot:CFRG4387T1
MVGHASSSLMHMRNENSSSDVLGGMKTSRTHHSHFPANNGAPSLKTKTIDIEFDNHKTHLDTHGRLPVVSPPSNDSKSPVMHLGVPLKHNPQGHGAEHGESAVMPVAEFEKYKTEGNRKCSMPRKDDMYFTFKDKTVDEYEVEIEYTMDEEDYVWLEEVVNQCRTRHEKISDVVFEASMDRLEKCSYRNNHEAALQVDDEAVCVICNDGDTEAGNAILFCDYCNIPVHQDCYGVVLIPEGQWLCRRCSVCADGRLVTGDCKLCPSKGGAFKQTMEGEWMHVNCAMWIPEVCFGNEQYLEPIMGVDKIPPARWKLKCYICGLNNNGACIQCSTKTCYAAYHATCARTANLYMKMGQIPESYCDLHTPASWGQPLIHTVGSTTGKPKTMITATLKKLLLDSGVGVSEVTDIDAAPLVAVPAVPVEDISTYLKPFHVPAKADFLKKIMPYWYLKRKSRSGVPLLRRLHAGTRGDSSNVLGNMETLDDNATDLKKRVQKLRIILERLRILAEFCVKREKLKRELLKIRHGAVLIQICPMVSSLSHLLDQLRKLDTKAYFHFPVDISEVTDYLERISHPMDFSTMGRKIEMLEYASLNKFRADFNLVVDNAVKYNPKRSTYHKEALLLKKKSNALFTAVKEKLSHINVDPNNGLLMPPGMELPMDAEDKAEEQLSHSVDLENKVYSTSRLEMCEGVEVENVNATKTESKSEKDGCAEKSAPSDNVDQKENCPLAIKNVENTPTALENDDVSTNSCNYIPNTLSNTKETRVSDTSIRTSSERIGVGKKSLEELQQPQNRTVHRRTLEGTSRGTEVQAEVQNMTNDGTEGEEMGFVISRTGPPHEEDEDMHLHAHVSTTDSALETESMDDVKGGGEDGETQEVDSADERRAKSFDAQYNTTARNTGLSTRRGLRRVKAEPIQHDTTPLNMHEPDDEEVEIVRKTRKRGRPSSYANQENSMNGNVPSSNNKQIARKLKQTHLNITSVNENNKSPVTTPNTRTSRRTHSNSTTCASANTSESTLKNPIVYNKRTRAGNVPSTAVLIKDEESAGERHLPGRPRKSERFSAFPLKRIVEEGSKAVNILKKKNKEPDETFSPLATRRQRSITGTRISTISPPLSQAPTKALPTRPLSGRSRLSLSNNRKTTSDETMSENVNPGAKTEEYTGVGPSTEIAENDIASFSLHEDVRKKRHFENVDIEGVGSGVEIMEDDNPVLRKRAKKDLSVALVKGNSGRNTSTLHQKTRKKSVGRPRKTKAF